MKFNIPTIKIKKPCTNKHSVPANIVFATNIINLSSRFKAKTIPFDIEKENRMPGEGFVICHKMLEIMNTSVLSQFDLSQYDGGKCAKASDESIKHLKNFSDPYEFFKWLKWTQNACAAGFGAWKNVSIDDRATVINIIHDGLNEYSQWVLGKKKKEMSDEQ